MSHSFACCAAPIFPQASWESLCAAARFGCFLPPTFSTGFWAMTMPPQINAAPRAVRKTILALLILRTLLFERFKNRGHANPNLGAKLLRHVAGGRCGIDGIVVAASEHVSKKRNARFHGDWRSTETVALNQREPERLHGLALACVPRTGFEPCGSVGKDFVPLLSGAAAEIDGNSLAYFPDHSGPYRRRSVTACRFGARIDSICSRWLRSWPAIICVRRSMDSSPRSACTPKSFHCSGERDLSRPRFASRRMRNCSSDWRGLRLAYWPAAAQVS